MQLLFYMFFPLMSLKDRLRLKLKVKTKISLCMAIMLDNPWQSLYTQYYRTVYQFSCKISDLLFTWFTCCDVMYGLHYNVLLELIIICYTRSKRVNGKIICLCTSSEENLFTCKIPGQKLLRILSYASS